MLDSSRNNERVKFPALEFIAIIHTIVAVISFISGLVIFVLALLASERNVDLIIGILIWTILAPLLLWGSGEMIRVFLSIEKNSRQTNYLLMELIRSGFVNTGQKQNESIRNLPEKIERSYRKPSSNPSISQMDDLDEKMEIARRIAKSQEIKPDPPYFILFYIVFFVVLIIGIFNFLGKK